MSVKATNWAYERGRELNLEQGPRFTLVRVADHADHDGVCWPGAEHIAEYTGASERTVRRHLQDLEDKYGLLHRERASTREEGRGRSNDKIFLHLDQPDTMTAGSLATPATGSGGGDADVPKDQPDTMTAGSQSDLPDTSDRPTGHERHDLPDTSDSALYREPSVEPSGTKQHVDSSADPVTEIYDFWKARTGRNGGTKLTPGRRTAVKARLDEGRTVTEVKRAITNCSRSPFHQGHNPQKRRYDDLTLICRNGEKLEDFRDMGSGAAAATPTALATRPSAPITETKRARECWAVAKRRLRDGLPASRYRAYVEPLEVAGERAGQIVLVDTTDQGQAGRIAEKLKGTILNALGGTFRAFEIVDETQLELEDR